MGKEELVKEVLRRHDISPSEAGLTVGDMVSHSIALITDDYKYTSISMAGILEGRAEYNYVALTDRERTVRAFTVYPAEECLVLNLEARTDVNSVVSFTKQVEAGACRIMLEVRFERPLRPGDETKVKIFYLIKDSIISRPKDYLSRFPKTSRGHMSFSSLTSTMRVPSFRNSLEVEYFGYRVTSFELVRALELDEGGFPKRYEAAKGLVSRKHEGGFVASFIPLVNSVTGVLYYLVKP